VIKGYDIIGDVHGCARALARLLEKLGYREQQGVFRHDGRQAIFVGDIVDRGPRVREALHLVKRMVDAGSALCVMGNHEYNAIGYMTLAPGDPNGEYLRPHIPRHNRCIAETLEQFEAYPDEWQMFLEWFKTLPIFLEMPGFRVVHACWDEELISQFKAQQQTNTVDMAFIHAAAKRGTFAYRFMDRLTRGTDMPLPDGLYMYSREGYRRSFFRTKFWADGPSTYRDVVFQPDPLPEAIADRRLSSQEQERLIRYDVEAPPVFVGHYWLQGQPKPLTHNVACLDYSAVKYGRLVAYRFDGESTLSQDKFVWVHVDPETVL
jgi:diadenosine tetraphosphatase ApaH/serine/threonine PP2A family protein phosphatase